MLMSSSLASSSNQTTSINLTKQQPNLFTPKHQFTSSTWVAADNALTPTVLAQPETATARVSLSQMLSLHVFHILTVRPVTNNIMTTDS
jgi:hypothetical protein